MAEALVIGGGISGVACANALARSGVDVELRDRGRSLGGRMATRTLRDTGTNVDGHIVDIGASYFTTSDPAFAAVVERLTAEGVVRPWTDAFHVADPTGIQAVRSGPIRYAAPRGLRSVVQDLVDERVVVRHATDVAEVSIDEEVRVDGDPFSAVALCMPHPQAVRLIDVMPDPHAVWEPVIVVTVVFESRCWIELDGVFVNDDAVLTWIADDGSRRADGAPVLVAHVHPVLSARHLQDPAAVIPAAVAAVQRVLAISQYPVWTDAHRWTFAKPTRAREEPCWLHDTAPVGVAGDEWAGGPRVEAAWLSGTALGERLAARITAAD